MKKNKTFLWVLGAVITGIIAAGLYFHVVYGVNNVKQLNISIIVYGNEAERWQNLRNGAEQAAKLYSDKYDIEFNLITVSQKTEAKEQMVLLEREINNGCDAIMLAIDNAVFVTDYLSNRHLNIPIVFLESGLAGENDTNLISANNYDMGYLIGRSIIDNENCKVKVAIITDNMKRESVQDRYQGVCDALDKNMTTMVFWERNQNELNIEPMLFLQRELVEEAVDVVVALDNESTEAISDAVINLNKNIKIYRIANSDKAVSCLDKGEIDLLVYENEFNIGYLGVQQLLSKSKNKALELEDYMEYRAITKMDMYSDENEKLVFPFVK